LGLLTYFEFDFAHEFHYVSCFVLLLSCLNVHAVQIGWPSSLAAAAVQGKITLISDSDMEIGKKILCRLQQKL
jgi:hypothetical protein